MVNKKFELAVLIVVIVAITFLSGLILGFNRASERVQITEMRLNDNMMPMHTHEKREMLMPYPTLNVEIIPDTKMGWNIYLKTTNFKFAPESVNAEHEAGEGHAHLYVNGERLTRLYAPWYYLKELPPGENVVTVSLSGNDHSDLYVLGEAVAVTKVIVVE